MRASAPTKRVLLAVLPALPQDIEPGKQAQAQGEQTQEHRQDPVQVPVADPGGDSLTDRMEHQQDPAEAQVAPPVVHEPAHQDAQHDEGQEIFA